jgi:histidyl-tRNA synthetase
MYHEGPLGPVQLCGGGRYDGLVKALGGRAQVPACGFSFGLERVDLALEQERDNAPGAAVESILVAPIESDDTAEAIRVSQTLRADGHRVELDLRYRGVRGNLRYADRAGMRHVILIGARERADGMVLVRDMLLREERLVPSVELSRALASAELPVS